MNNPNENIKAVTDLISEIKNHPMCMKFEDQGSHYQVIYPDGDFRINGVRASTGGGKQKALYRILDRMEQDWVASSLLTD